MEIYSGVKFEIENIGEQFDADDRLPSLNRWAYVFAELGLAPVHSAGAFGNHSYRDTGESFIITRTGMIPCGQLDKEDFCRASYDIGGRRFVVQGRHQPSSESFLHYSIYQNYPEVNAVMHGHSALLNEYADALGITVTPEEFPYGTAELARSAVDALVGNSDFFILKNHGFVGVGDSVESAAITVLKYYGNLLRHL